MSEVIAPGSVIVPTPAPVAPVAPIPVAHPAPAVTVTPRSIVSPVAPAIAQPTIPGALPFAPIARPAVPGAPAPVGDAPIPMTADEKQALQVKRMTDDQRRAADKEAAAAKRKAQKEFQAERIKREHDHNRVHADKLYLGMREIKIVRDAQADDIGNIEPEACSVVQYLDNLVEAVVQDKDIKTQPTP